MQQSYLDLSPLFRYIPLDDQLLVGIKRTTYSEILADSARTPTLGGAGGARIALHTEFFPSLLSSEGAFPGIADDLVPEYFSGGKPPNPQSAMASLGDQYTRHSSSGKEFRNQNLPLWRNIHIHRCALRGSLAALP